MGNLVDRLGAGRHQPFHAKLRRRLQPHVRSGFGFARILEQPHEKGIEVPIDHAVAREQRGFHFQESVLVKKVPHGPQQLSAPPKMIPVCRGTEIVLPR